MQITGQIKVLRPEHIKNSQNSIRKQSTQLKYMGKIFEQTYHQRQYTDGKLAYEEMFNILVTREMQIKTAVRYYDTSSSIAKI